MFDEEEYELETIAVRAGQQRTHEGEQSEPIFPTSSYVFKNAAEAEARFKGEQPGNIYSRFTNPTVRTFEQRLAKLEGGSHCVATASGMSAILSTCLGLLQTGDHIVSSNAIFGTTVILFNKYLKKFGIDTNFVPLINLDAWRKAIKPSTRLLFVETPSNPLAQIADIKALSKLAHENNCILVVDNCLSTPILQQPLALGADIVIHSATKYIDGQGRCMGGAVIGNEKNVGEDIFGVLRTAGPTMSAFNAWVFLKGLETLPIRMKVHSENAMELASWLENHSAVSQVYYAGLKSHPQHKLAFEQQHAFGGVVAFDVNGTKKDAWSVIDSTKLLSITANLGDAKTTITHPATTTHGRLSDEEKLNAGITDSLIRVSVGLENINDIKNDLDRGLKKISAA
ncbi:MAG: O-succinylhomoserine sulfhydrylase [Gammaproteobacteria bacterium]